MNLQIELEKLSDEDLLEQTKNKVLDERALTNQVLDHLREIQRRRLYAKLGYSSLFQYCTDHLNYCNASAQLRIDAMRLSQELPEIKESLENGTLNLSVIGTFQKFIRQEKVKKTYSKEEKANLLKQIETKSKEEAERFFIKLSPSFIPKEKQIVVSETQSEIRFIADIETLELMAKVKAKLVQNGDQDPSFAALFKYALKKTLKIPLKLKEEKAKSTSPEEVVASPQKENQQITKSTSSDEADNGHMELMDYLEELKNKTSPQNQTRPAIPVKVKEVLLKKSNNQCTYASPLTGKRCGETRFLQIEHVTPFAQGGSSEMQNLSVLCACHNRQSAIESYGTKKMQPYLKW